MPPKLLMSIVFPAGWGVSVNVPPPTFPSPSAVKSPSKVDKELDVAKIEIPELLKVPSRMRSPFTRGVTPSEAKTRCDPTPFAATTTWAWAEAAKQRMATKKMNFFMMGRVRKAGFGEVERVLLARSASGVKALHRPQLILLHIDDDRIRWVNRDGV